MSDIKILYIKDLNLHNYRNHNNFSAKFDERPVVLYGNNGIGKTNILEAISFLSPGKGLRNANLDEIIAHGKEDFSIKSNVNSIYGPMEVYVKYEPKKMSKRQIFINDQNIKSQSELSKIFSVIWLTPLMDQIFIGPSSARRKFIDRLSLNFNEDHSLRVSQYESLMAERLHILKKRGFTADKIWLSSIEKQMSEIGVAIATSRIETIEYIQIMIDESDTIFPKAKILIKGELEEKVKNTSSLKLENEFREILEKNREIDLHSNRTNAGINRSDLLVYHLKNDMAADKCSTGEQKALLLAIILAEARARVHWKASAPVLLLDEVVAHLDEKRRSALFEKLLGMKVQCWLTGTDYQMFGELIKDKAQFVNLE